MWWLLFVPSFLGGAAQEAAAQQPRITQTVIVSAATQPVPLDVLARAVVVITRDEIRTWRRGGSRPAFVPDGTR